MKKLLAYLSLLIPHSLLPSSYIHKRLEYLLDDPATCTHEWDVVAGILNGENGVELQVQCHNCGTYSEVPDPTIEEWEACADAMENPYPWTDLSRIRYYFVDGTVH
ncbi:hypothetical protein [uncultured Roseibium sp.]|uniref:hypothetical protein n=1 Tax=uncultured Roseibium sp. TaxID=1936171 RepID=UPI0032179B47